MPKRPHFTAKGRSGEGTRKKIKTSGGNSTNGTNVVWNKNGTSRLLSLYQENRDTRDPIAKYESDFYEKIARAMKNNGYDYNSRQCYNKIYRLFNRYKRIKDDYNQTGEIDQEWEYYEVMDDFVNGRLVITPEASCSTLLRVSEPLDKNQDQNKNLNILQFLRSKTGYNSQGEEIHSAKSEALKCLEILKKDEDERKTHRLNILEKHQAENAELLKALMEKVQ